MGIGVYNILGYRIAHRRESSHWIIIYTGIIIEHSLFGA